MKRNLSILIFSLLGISLSAAKLSSLPGINRPYSLAVEGKKVYISEKSSVSIYSLDDFKLVKKFGRKGEGPGEFKSFPMVESFPGDLVVNCFWKVLFFSHSGDFKKEIRSPHFSFYVYPVGDNLVGILPKTNKESGKKNKAITLLSKDMKIIKEIAVDDKAKKSRRRNLEAIKDCFMHKVYNGNIYIGDTNKGFYIGVFDSKGNKLYEINKKYEKSKVSDEYKEEYLKKIKNPKDFLDRAIKDRYKYIFKDYFPAFKSFMVKDDRIYAFTHKRINKKIEVVVMDLKGNTEGRVFLTIAEPGLFYLSNGNYYYLEENEETGNYELFVEKQ